MSTFISTLFVGIIMENFTENLQGPGDKDDDNSNAHGHGLGLETVTAQGFARLLDKRRLKLNIDVHRDKREISIQSAPTSPNVAVYDLTWDEDEAKSIRANKRKREESIIANRRQEEETKAKASELLATTIRKVIKKIEKEIGSVATYAREKNTKKEIKEAAAKLTSLISQINTEEAKLLLQKLGKDIGKEEIGNTTGQDARINELEDEIKKLKRQNRILNDEVIALKKKDGNYRPAMEEGLFKEGYDNFKGVVDNEWSEKIYKSAFMAAGSPVNANKDTDLVVLEEVGTGNDAIWRECLQRYPDIGEVVGKVGVLTVTTKTMGLGIQNMAHEKWVVKAVVNDTGREWFDTLVEIKDVTQSGGRKKLAVYPPEGDQDGSVTRKMMEYIFRDTGMKCLIYNKSRSNPNNKGRRPVRDTDVLFLKQEGKTYAELLRTFKEKVKPDTAGGRAIRTIREGKDGRMVVVLQKNNEAVKQINNDIGKDMHVSKGGNREDVAVYIYDLDSITTADEVKKTISETVNEEEDNIKVGELRNMVRGNRAVTAYVSKAAASKLLSYQGIKVGLNWCPVKERVEVIRCYKCNQYGHIGKECKETRDESGLCRKCGRAGHKIKDCSEAEFCLTCKERGHVAGTGACPEFRRAINKEREKRKNPNGH